MTDTKAGKEASRGEDTSEQAQKPGTVFWVTVTISAAFVLWGVLFTDNFASATAAVVGWITGGLGWLYMLITTFFLAFVVYLAFSKQMKEIMAGSPRRHLRRVVPTPPGQVAPKPNGKE